jgi:hypothetical protein
LNDEITLPVKLGYSDGSGIDDLTITDAKDRIVVWGRTSLDPAVSGVRSPAIAQAIIAALNARTGVQ